MADPSGDIDLDSVIDRLLEGATTSTPFPTSSSSPPYHLLRCFFGIGATTLASDTDVLLARGTPFQFEETDRESPSSFRSTRSSTSAPRLGRSSSRNPSCSSSRLPSRSVVTFTDNTTTCSVCSSTVDSCVVLSFPFLCFPLSSIAQRRLWLSTPLTASRSQLPLPRRLRRPRQAVARDHLPPPRLQDQIP
jgi:hypothetical protein